MAEIYKQQVEYKTTEAEQLRTPQYKNYMSQGLDNLNKGFQQLDEYMAYTDDKMLAGSMDNIKDEAVTMIEEWQDFNTDGRQKLFSSIMEKYDNALATAPMSAQRRFAISNPDARNIFALKVNEQMLKKARDQVFEAEKRDASAYADKVAAIEDPVENEKMFRSILNEINANRSKMLTMTDLGQISDATGHDMALQTINQAIVREDVAAAKRYLNNRLYTRYLGPEEKNRLQHAVLSLEKSVGADEASAPGTKDAKNELIKMRNAFYDIYGPEYADSAMNDITRALMSNRSLKDTVILKGFDTQGRPASDALFENGLKDADYWDKLDATTKQLAVNQYEKIISPALPEEYKTTRNYLSAEFQNLLRSHSSMQPNPVTGKDEVVVDLSTVKNDDMRELIKLSDALKMYSVGTDEYTKKNLDALDVALMARRAQAGKTMSLPLAPVQQRMAGTIGSTNYLHGGNITQAMIKSAQGGEEKMSVIDAMLQNMVSVGEEGTVLERNLKNSDVGKIKRDDLGRLGMVLGGGEMSPTKTDYAWLYQTGGDANAEAVSASFGDYLKAIGEVDENGNLVVPKANTYRFLTEIIPTLLGYVSVFGNEKDLQGTGIKPGVIKDQSIYDLTMALQDMYDGMLDDTVKAYNPSGYRTNTIGPLATEITGIKDSDPYSVLMTALDVAKNMGLVSGTPDPNSESIVDLGYIINGFVKDARAKARETAPESSAQKRINYKTKAMQQYKQFTKKG